MSRNADDVELDELLRRLKKLKAKFPEEGGAGTGGNGGPDGFADLEELFLRRVANVTEMLKATNSNSDTVSVTDQIRSRTNAHNEITAIADTVRKMGDLIQTERKKKAKGKGKISDEEMVRRELNIQTFTIKLNQLSQQIQKGRQGPRNELFEGYVPRTTISRDQLFGTGPIGQGASQINMAAASRAGVGFTEPAGGASLSAEQQQSLAEIYRRDEEQDKMIEEIGEIILEAGQLAMSINETVVMQKAMLDDVEKHVDSAQDNLINVNSQLKKTLEAKGMSWERMCMIFLCTVFILGLVGVMIPKS